MDKQFFGNKILNPKASGQGQGFSVLLKPKAAGGFATGGGPAKRWCRGFRVCCRGSGMQGLGFGVEVGYCPHPVTGYNGSNIKVIDKYIKMILQRYEVGVVPKVEV